MAHGSGSCCLTIFWDEFSGKSDAGIDGSVYRCKVCCFRAGGWRLRRLCKQTEKEREDYYFIFSVCDGKCVFPAGRDDPEADG